MAIILNLVRHLVYSYTKTCMRNRCFCVVFEFLDNFPFSMTLFYLNHKVLILQTEDHDGKQSQVFNGFVSTQPAFTCSNLTIEALEQGVEYVQS